MDRLPPNPLASVLEGLQMPQPPAWLIHEIRQRVVLFTNHVLQQEPQAMQRLAQFHGRTILVERGPVRLPVVLTRAGLLDLAAEPLTADLTVTFSAPTTVGMMRDLALGERPELSIHGDAQLATEIGWVAENVRWDYEEDLARVFGDVPARVMGGVARQLAQGLRRFGRTATKSP